MRGGLAVLAPTSPLGVALPVLRTLWFCWNRSTDSGISHHSSLAAPSCLLELIGHTGLLSKSSGTCRHLVYRCFGEAGPAPVGSLRFGLPNRHSRLCLGQAQGVFHYYQPYMHEWQTRLLTGPSIVRPGHRFSPHPPSHLPLRWKPAVQQSLKERLKEIIPERVAEVKEVRQKFGTKSLGNVTVDMVSSET